MFSKQQLSALLVAFASVLWSTDPVVRSFGMTKAHPLLFILAEHLLAVVLLMIWIRMRHKNLFCLTQKQWFAALFCGTAGSAIAMVFFSTSITLINPSVAILLQKLQPIFVTFFAMLFLKEKPAKHFLFLALIAIGAATILSTEHFSLNAFTQDMQLKGLTYALLAGILWAASTVAGKILSHNTDISVITFWRFFFGFIMLTFQCIFIESISFQEIFHAFSDHHVILIALYLSLIPGLFAMLLYYHGLSKTKANIVGIIELLYPLCACILNAIFLESILTPIQMTAGSILILAVGYIASH